MRRVGSVIVLLLGISGLWVAAARRGSVPSGGSQRQPVFDPVFLANTEADGWRAYYDRDFVQGFRLLLRLVRGQMGLGALDSLRAAYYAVRAQMAFAPKANDPDAARTFLTRFYLIAPHRDGVEPADLADAELDYWVVHRQIVHQEDKAALVDSFARLHTLLFGGDIVTMRPSAEQRTLACNAVDRITSRRSTDPDHDWSLVRQHLIAAYQLAADVVHGTATPESEMQRALAS